MEKPPVRHLFDPKAGKDYFSVVDVVGYVTDTVDARNYWKVLKNRLKKSSPELVTLCNRLKMMSKDGKFYFTDVADAETILQIAEVVPGANMTLVKDCLCSIKDTGNPPSVANKEPKNYNLPDEAKLLIDAYQTEKEIFIIACTPGVPVEDISVSLFHKKIMIRGKINREQKIPEKDFLIQELLWTNFSRTLLLPDRKSV